MEQQASHVWDQSMKYVLLAYRIDKEWDALSASERDALENACLANEQELRQSGRLFAVVGPQRSRTAVTVRVVNDKVSLADGSFAETSGQLIQLSFVNARDLNEAIQVASKMPQTRTGPIEVRPIVVLNEQ